MDRRKRRLLLASIALQLVQRKLLFLRLRQQMKRRRMWVHGIFQRRTELGLFHRLMKEMAISNQESYVNYFRMTPSAMDGLLQLVAPLIQKAITYCRKPIEPAQRLCITLRYLAAGDSMRSMSYNYRVGYSTVSKIIKETCRALWDALKMQYMALPKDAEWCRVAKEFHLLWNFPNCVGALDGKHVAMQAPTNSGSINLNYKNYHSRVLMAMCDARYRFTMIDVGAPGRQNDSATFRGSPFGEMLESGAFQFPQPPPLPGNETTVPYMIVADEAFPLRTYLMRPYPGLTLNLHQRIFNHRLRRAHRTIENTFGILANRWRVLRGSIIAQEDTVDAIIRACCCLHNYVLANNRQLYAPPALVDSLLEDGGIRPGSWRSDDVAMDPLYRAGSTNHTADAEKIREILTLHLMSSNGEVPWQYDCI